MVLIVLLVNYLSLNHINLVLGVGDPITFTTFIKFPCIGEDNRGCSLFVLERTGIE